LVAGESKRIGKAIALQGCDLVIAARNSAELEAADEGTERVAKRKVGG
jgi:short-subunit dehydrogenase